MTWSELFFDLIFVTGVRLLGDLLRVGLIEAHEGNETLAAAAPLYAQGFGEEEKEASITLAQYCALFFALWALWIDQTNYGTRWGANTVWSRVAAHPTATDLHADLQARLFSYVRDCFR